MNHFEYISKKLFVELQKREAPGVVLLTQWVRYLKNNRYNADLNATEFLCNT